MMMEDDDEKKEEEHWFLTSVYILTYTTYVCDIIIFLLHHIY